MPRFYMHVREDGEEASDGEGFDATDQLAATLLGVRAAGQIIADEFAMGRHPVSFTLCIDDDEGNRLETLPVRASVG